MMEYCLFLSMEAITANWWESPHQDATPEHGPFGGVLRRWSYGVPDASILRRVIVHYHITLICLESMKK